MRGLSSPVPPAGSVPPIPRRRQPPPTHCGAKHRNGRDLIIAKNDQRTNPYPHCCQRQRRKRYKRSPEPTTSPAAPIPRSQHRQIRTCPPRAKGPLDRRSKRLSFPHFFLRRKKCGRRRPPPRQGKANSPPQRRKRALFVSAGDSFAPRRELLLSAVTKVAKSTGRNCVSALPQRAMPVHCRPRFPSRNRRFPDRCRSADCASTAFRCRCLLLRQKLFVLPCRRLRNNYIRAQRAHLPLPP